MNVVTETGEALLGRQLPADALLLNFIPRMLLYALMILAANVMRANLVVEQRPESNLTIIAWRAD